MSLTSYRAAPSRVGWYEIRFVRGDDRIEERLLRLWTVLIRTLAATYSPTGEPAVPLALKCFTAGFGMGPGGATLLWPPEEQGFWMG